MATAAKTQGASHGAPASTTRYNAGLLDAASVAAGTTDTATTLLLLLSFTVVNGALVVLKRRPGEPRGGFEVPIVVPILGAIVCVAMMGNGVWRYIAGFVEHWPTDRGEA